MNSDQTFNPSGEKVTTSAIRFTGRGSDYFRIWIVNIFLTIVTLGIYSAWATVRTKKYFYQHTKLFDHGFDFHARPTQILKSRVLAFAIYILYVILSEHFPTLAAFLLIPFYLALPLLVLLALQFRLANTSYRGIRFRFAGKTSEAYFTYLVVPILTVASLGLALPYLSYRSYQYWLSNICYGKEQFKANLSLREFYLIYLKLLGGLILAGGLLYGILALVLQSFDASLIAFLPLTLLAILLLARPYLTARLLNHAYGSTRIGMVFFESNYSFKGLLGLAVTNFIMVAASFGLLMPFARIRKARYMAEHLTSIAEGELDHFIAGTLQDVNARGDEIADFFNVDVPAIG